MTQGTVGGSGGRRLTRPRGRTAPGRRSWGLGLVAAVLLGLSWTGHGHGAPGDLDPTFGTQGIVTTAFGWLGSLDAMILQPDGKIVAGGESSASMNTSSTSTLVRYQPDGRLDATFGAGGMVTTPPPGVGLMAGLVLQPDGKLVAAGTLPTPPVHVPVRQSSRLARFLPDGRLDPTFGDAGLVTTPADWSVAASALIVQPDGRLVLAGSGGPCQLMPILVCFPISARLVRFQPDGHLDPTFGTGGLVTTTFPSESGSTFSALVLQPDGRLVAAGVVTVSGSQVFALARYEVDGRLDPTFGTGGLVTTDLGGAALNALVLQPDGRLVAGGSVTIGFVPSGGTQVFGLARYLTLDVLEAFVTGVYRAALARPPDASEVAYWVDVLTTTPTPDTVRGMLHVVFDSPEFLQRPVNPWQYVEALYQAMLGRESAPAEMDWWVQAVLDRVNTALPAFLDSPECRGLVHDCQDVGVVTLLVGRLYQQALRRVPSWEEVAWWAQAIVAWCAVEDAVEDFFNSLEYLAVPRTLADHVTVLYRVLLAREADAGEQAWWVAYLAGQLAVIEDDVMASPEFEARVDRLFP